jgi:hypothetical protein
MSRPPPLPQQAQPRDPHRPVTIATVKTGNPIDTQPLRFGETGDLIGRSARLTGRATNPQRLHEESERQGGNEDRCLAIADSTDQNRIHAKAQNAGPQGLVLRVEHADDVIVLDGDEKRSLGLLPLSDIRLIEFALPIQRRSRNLTLGRKCP